MFELEHLVLQLRLCHVLDGGDGGGGASWLRRR
jgi:hypothetical protein